LEYGTYARRRASFRKVDQGLFFFICDGHNSPDYFFLDFRSSFLMARAGMPTTNVSSATFLVTMAPAPVRAP
jgi:hypothetical protein